MRPTLLPPALLLAALALSQPSGTYRSSGSSASWRIDEHNALIWNGAPYLPVGAVSEGTDASIQSILGSGLRDVLLELPAGGNGWQPAFGALDKASARYLLKISSLAPMARGVAVEPEGYRFPGLVDAKRITLPIPGSTSALVVLASQRDGSIAKHERVPTPGGLLDYQVPSINGLEHVLLVYPEATSLEQPDFWEGLDAHRDSLVEALRRSPPGPGLRGIVNPLGRLLRLPGREGRFVPTSAFFRDELRERLEAKYRNSDTATRAWVIRASDLDGFDALARLVPLWSGTRGVPMLWDPATDRLYESDSRRSAAWQDINDTILIAATRRFKRLAASIRLVADVPIVQEWAGWAPPYDGSTVSIDGIGMRSSGASRSSVVESTCRATSSLLRWRRPGWLLATDIDPGDDPAQFGNVLNDLGSLGARGWFFRTSTPNALTSLADGSAMAWADGTVQALFYPETATNPAMPQRLPGGRWWLPSPAAGERIDMGSLFAAYRFEDDAGAYTALWSVSGPRRTILRLADPKTVKFESVDGSDPKPKQVKKGVEVTLSETPLIVRSGEEIPVPDEAVSETVDQFTGCIRAVTPSQDLFAEEQYWFREASAGFERNPGGSLLGMRAVLYRLLLKMSPFAWVEGESSRLHSFSEVVPDPGCSGRAALTLRSRVPAESHTAEFNLPVRYLGDQELWIAARIPADARKSVTATLGSQAFTLEGEPTAAYGAGYAWYRLGTTKLSGQDAKLSIIVEAPVGTVVSIDAIVLYPGAFRPRGAFMPRLEFEPVKPAKP